MEEIEIVTDNISNIPGMELLMNEKHKPSSMSTSIDIDDLNDLETELNDLTKNVNTSNGGNSFIPNLVNTEKNTNVTKAPSSSFEDNFSNPMASFSNFFGLSSGGAGGGSTNKRNLGSGGGGDEEEEYNATESNIGRASVNNSNIFSSTPPPLPHSEYSSSNADSKMVERERRRKKRMMLKKLDEWYEKGITRVKFYNDTDYTEIEDEYEACMDEKRRKDSVKLQGWWFMTIINSIEYGNAIFNPFDLNLDGWGEQVNEDIESYEEIFTELYQKYKGGKLSPEISLLLRLGFSAAVVNLTNKALSTSTPAFNDVIKQSPELMKMFTDATVKTMKSQNQPAASFMGDVFNSNISPQAMFGNPPPPPSKTQPPPPSNRPDITVSRSINENTPLFKEKGVELDDRSYRFSEARPRPEMKGPQKRPETSDLLNGLKKQTSIVPPPLNVKNIRMDDNGGGGGVSDYETESVVSASSLHELHKTGPKRYGKRKNGSDKNTISLDI